MSRHSALTWLNRLLPGDGGVGRVISGVRYGAHARGELDVYCPAKSDGAAPTTSTAPIVFFIYGGGWNAGSRLDYAFVGRAFAAAGFVCVIADYRLVPDVHFPGFLEDAGAALHWVDANIATYGGDKNRLFLMGHSAGAYNAVMMGLVGTQYGGPDLAGRVKGVVGLAGPYDFYPFDVQEAIDAFGQVAKPLETQPVELVHPDMPPLLLLHGEKDETCLPRNSRALAARTLAAGGEVETHYYAGLAHAGILLALFRPLRWRAPVHRQALAFMRARLA